MLKNEKSNDRLKKLSEQWWSSHSQDYQESSDEYYRGAKIDLPDENFLDYLEEIDSYFQRDAYFAQNRNDKLFETLLPKSISGSRVLEIGCGLGSHSERLARKGAILSSIDISKTSVDVTKRRFELKKLKGDIIKADAEYLPFDDDTFDVIWSWGVIHHSPNTVQCASEIMRVLKPGGELRIMLYHERSLYCWLNVYLRYGVFALKFLQSSRQELKNKYTDGRHIGGAPLSKYYTRKDVRQIFSKISFHKQISFEQKKVISNFFPSKWRKTIENYIPDALYTFVMARVGFLLFSVGKKNGK